MTRPHIIRADTIDLQDKSSPTAQDHSHQPQHPAPLGIGPAAPHQQATLRSVEDERNTEEARLQHAWEHAADSLGEDVGSDDDESTVTTVNGHQAPKQGTSGAVNRDMDDDDDDGDMHDADEEDMDDDMLDKMSSSPSIDDGVYFPTSQPLTWPLRRESLTPLSSPLASVASSSPFTTTPIHYPLSVAEPRRSPGVSTSGADLFSTHSPSTPASISPISSHLSQQHSKIQSLEHHHGEYTWTAINNTMGDPENADYLEDTDEFESAESLKRTENRLVDPEAEALKLVERRLQIMREDSHGSLMSELDEEQARIMLQSARRPFSDLADDPFLEPTEPAPRTKNGTPVPKTEPDEDEDEDESWTTDSDADSWDAYPDNNDDASNDIFLSDDSRFIDSGWGGECLRETEDIDFEFVYALHTFVATVEGQANATKGDTMVLLDDSNSYWWLVRVVKDSSIGYLPAEHIETPTERLARLNKHRNIDLSATMLGDTAEKTKNPLKKAMRRRNAKNVQFAPPTYVEASDYDYSSDEDNDELFGGPEPNQAQQQQTAQNTESDQDDLKVQPLKLGAKKGASEDASADGAAGDARTSDDSIDRPLDQKVTRNGTVRNTDSFFKDENTETRKITLTPNLLRDDSSTSTTGSKERGPSLESLEKNGFADKPKEDKKKKEKKGMLSGLFKRKDKKDKGSKGDLSSIDSDGEKVSEEIGRTSPQPKPSEESSERPSNERQSNERQSNERQSNERQSSERQSNERQSSERQSSERSAEEPAAPAPLRQSNKSKLQKQLRARNNSPIKTKGILKTDSPMDTAEDEAEPVDSKPAAQRDASTMRMVEPETEVETKQAEPEQATASTSQSVMSTMGSMNPFKSSNHGQPSEPKPEKVKKSKQRVQLDDFDSDEESEDPFADQEADNKAAQQESEPIGRLSESPVLVSAADAQPSARENMQREVDSQQPPGLTGDTSSQDTNSPAPTPPLIDSPATIVPEKSELRAARAGTSPSPGLLSPDSNTIPASGPTTPSSLSKINTSPPVSSESTMLPAWSDTCLRSFLEDGSEIRDLLLVVNDTTGVVPVGKDHPLMSGLFVEETKAVQDLSSELDRLLGGLMDKRMKRAGSGASKASSARSRR